MSYVPTFNGEAIFGLDTVVVTGSPAMDYQINKFNGVIGVEVLTYGTGQYNSIVTGRMWGQGIDGLAQAEEYMKSYRNGLAYDFFSTNGLVYPLVMLISVEPIPRITASPDGLAFRGYRATLLHLI